MITLKQAIKLLDLKDNDMIFICKKHCEDFAPYCTVKKIKEKFDMKNTIVKKIYPYHYLYNDSFDWEFIIDEKQLNGVKL